VVIPAIKLELKKAVIPAIKLELKKAAIPAIKLELKNGEIRVFIDSNLFMFTILLESVKIQQSFITLSSHSYCCERTLMGGFLCRIIL